MGEVVLRELGEQDEPAVTRATRSLAESDADFEFAFGFDEHTDFDWYLDLLEREKRGEDLHKQRVPHSFYAAFQGDKIVGRLSIRHRLNDSLLQFGGHIGFVVLAAFRRQGIGTAILRQGLPLASRLGIDRALVTCDEDNVGSRRIIEACGGIFEDTRPRPEGGVTRRYWIETKR
jgi:predicted acetyltransferase